MFAPSASASDAPETIVVTAERRDDSRFDVPIAVDAFSGSQLSAESISNAFELQTRIPSLVSSRNTVLGQPHLRGIGSDLLSAAADSSVITVIDEVYRTRAVAAEPTFFDVDRVEVLKGPQSTLFGRNATGGVIHVVHRTPTPNFAAGARLRTGSFESVEAESFVNAPILEDRLALRVSGLRRQRDGLYRDLGPGGNYREDSLWAGRAQLAFSGDRDFEALLSADYSRDRGLRGGIFKLREPLAGSPAAAAGGNVPRNPWVVDLNRTPSSRVDLWGSSLRLAKEWGGFELISTTAYRVSDLEATLDLDTTNLDFLANAPAENSRAWTQEIRGLGRLTDWLEGQLGVFYLHEDVEQTFDVEVPIASIEDSTDAEVLSNAFAVFGQGTAELLRGFEVTVGTRYSWERRQIAFDETVNGAIVADFDGESDWHDVSPRFVLEWKPGPDARTYFSITRGFKSGGFNTAAAQRRAFDPESLWSYELGIKLRELPGGTSLSLAGFFYDYRNLQLNVTVPSPNALFPEVRNAAEATVAGAELELDFEPVDRLRLEGCLTGLFARIDDLSAVDPNAPTSDPDQSGNRLPRAPTVALFTAAQYTLPVGALEITPRIEYAYQSKVYFNVYADNQVAEPGYGLLNARIDLEIPALDLRATVFGRNLTDVLYAHSRIRLDGQIGNLAAWGDPRMIGFELAARF